MAEIISGKQAFEKIVEFRLLDPENYKILWNQWINEKISIDENFEIDFKKYIFNADSWIVTDFQQLDFSGFIFPEIDFRQSQFDEAVDFGESTFKSTTYFDEVNFKSVAYFRNAEFHGDTYFNELKFQSDAYFGNVNFYKTVYFFACKFITTANFRETEFHKDTYFSEAIFEAGVDFGETKFHSDTYFDGAKFKEITTFDKAIFDAFTYFRNSKFHKELSFKSAEFSMVSFDGMNSLYVPDFSFVIFNKDISLFGIVIPKKAPKGQTEYLDNSNVNDITDRYRWLKKMASTADDHDRRLFFFTAEMYAKLGNETKGVEKIPNYLYWLASDYGASMARPTIGLLLTWGIGLLSLVLLTGELTYDMIILSLSYLLPRIFFNELHIALEAGAFQNIAETLQYDLLYISWIEGLFGTLFLFFIGLALRNRFLIE